MKIFQIYVTDQALNDMKQIYDYISFYLESPQVALKQYNRIAKAIERLNFMPNRNKVINLGLERSVNIRQMIVDNYSIIYNIKDDVITVLRDYKK